MKITIFNSLPEALTYFLLLIMLGFNIVGLVITLNSAQQTKKLADEIKENTSQVEKQVSCISAYFNTGGRTGNTTLNSLSSCDIK